MHMTSSDKRERDRKDNRDGQAEFVMATLQKYERPLTRYVSRLLTGDLSAARDVVQHAFLKLCESDYREIEDRAAPWLYTVCRNRAIDLIRGRNSEEQLDPKQHNPDDGVRLYQNGKTRHSDPASIVEQADSYEELQALINELPETQREVVELWSQGFSSVEVGEIIGKKSGAVRIALHRAVKQLRSHESVERWLSEADDQASIKNRI